MIDEQYVKREVTKEWLLSHDFRYNRIFSDEEDDAYTYRFSVYKYGTFDTLEAEILIFLSDGDVRVNVYASGTRSKYAPFYQEESAGHRDILNKINAKILKEFERLGIEKL